MQDASIDLEVDKVATQEDAAKVLDAELRGSPTGTPIPGGVAAAVQAAADINKQAGYTPASSLDHERAFPLEDTPVPENTPKPSPAELAESLPTPAPEKTPNASPAEPTESLPTPASGEEKVHAKEDWVVLKESESSSEWQSCNKSYWALLLFQKSVGDPDGLLATIRQF